MHVLIIGGGYAGVLAAARLAGGPVETTLVDPRPAMVERTRLHEVAAGRGPPVHPYAALLAPLKTRFLQGRAEKVCDDGAWVDGRFVPADRVLLAVGSAPGPAPDGAFQIASLEGALALQARLAEAPEAAVAVVGGGLTGLELATELAEREPGRAVRLVAPALGEDLSPEARAHLLATLERLGVTWVLGSAAPSLPLRLADGAPVPGDIVVWATGFSVPSLARDSGLPVTETGRVRVGPTLQVEGHPTIYAAGDAAFTVHRPLRQSCATAMPMAAHAASNLLREQRGEAPRPMSFGFLVRCLSLGRREGLLQFTDRDDQAVARFWSGRKAVWAKEGILRATVALPALEGRLGLPLYRWPTRGTAQITEELPA